MLHYRLSETNSQCRRAWSGNVRRLNVSMCVRSGIKLTKTVNHRMKTFLNLFFFFGFVFVIFVFVVVLGASQQNRPTNKATQKFP